MIFAAKYVSAMVFGGGILGGACKIWGNPYLNSMTVLFDTASKMSSKWRSHTVELLSSCEFQYGTATKFSRFDDNLFGFKTPLTESKCYISALRYVI